MKNLEPRLEALSREEMGRLAGGDDTDVVRWMIAAFNWVIETAAYAPASSYAYGKVGYT